MQRDPRLANYWWLLVLLLTSEEGHRQKDWLAAGTSWIQEEQQVELGGLASSGGRASGTAACTAVLTAASFCLCSCSRAAPTVGLARKFLCCSVTLLLIVALLLVYAGSGNGRCGNQRWRPGNQDQTGTHGKQESLWAGGFTPTPSDQLSDWTVLTVKLA